MPLIDAKNREIQCKIVYYGPPRSGKTTNFQHLYNVSNDFRRSDLLFVPSKRERVIFFSLVPFKQVIIRDFLVRFYLYTIPGNIQYNESLIDILSGVDGIVFVVDSQRQKLKENNNS